MLVKKGERRRGRGKGVVLQNNIQFTSRFQQLRPTTMSSCMARDTTCILPHISAMERLEITCILPHISVMER